MGRTAIWKRFSAGPYYSIRETRSGVRVCYIASKPIADVKGKHTAFDCVSWVLEIEILDEIAPRDIGFFSQFENVHSITGLDKIETGNITDMSRAFSGCQYLTTLDGAEDWDTSNVESMEGMFYGCSSLKDLSALAKWNTSKVEDMSWMFSGCTKILLRAFNKGLSAWDTSNVRYMTGMFSEARSLNTLKALASWDTSNVVDMGGLFSHCTKLKNVDWLENWDTSKVESIGMMFAYCTSLSSVSGCLEWDLGSCVDFSKIFAGCNELDNADFLKGVVLTDETDFADMLSDSLVKKYELGECKDYKLDEQWWNQVFKDAQSVLERNPTIGEIWQFICITKGFPKPSERKAAFDAWAAGVPVDDILA